MIIDLCNDDTEGAHLRQEVEGIAKVCHPARSNLLSEENKIIKVLAQCKNSNSPNGPLTSVEELYTLQPWQQVHTPSRSAAH